MPEGADCAPAAADKVGSVTHRCRCMVWVRGGVKHPSRACGRSYEAPPPPHPSGSSPSRRRWVTDLMSRSRGWWYAWSPISFRDSIDGGTPWLMIASGSLPAGPPATLIGRGDVPRWQVDLRTSGLTRSGVTSSTDGAVRGPPASPRARRRVVPWYHVGLRARALSAIPP